MPPQKHARNEALTRRGRPVYKIPDTPRPTGTRCVRLIVPDSLDHLAALSGAIRELTKWRNWALDSEHNATKCAGLWSELLAANPIEFAECEAMQVQFRVVDTCFLQASFDGGETWETIYNGYPCAAIAAQDTIESFQNNNNLPGGGQPPAQGGGAPSECYYWTVELRANDRWKIPIALAAGDVVTVTEATGGWTDNLPNVGYWYCPDGQQYILGACNESESTSETDPAPTVYHMRLIGQFGDVYTDMYNTDYAIPLGENIDGFFQANDVNIQDNGGSIKFKVSVCKSADAWATETLSVDFANASAVETSKNTHNGKIYQITVTGIGSVWTGTILDDAFYWDFTGNWSSPDLVPGDNNQLWVNGAVVPDKPSYSSVHTYVLTYAGTGGKFSFIIRDTGTRGDNSGSLSVQIVQL